MLEGRKCQNCFHFDEVWWFFHSFAIESRKLVHFGHIKKIALLLKIDCFWVGMGATRCLKAKFAKNMFTLTILLFFLLFCVKVIKVHFGHRQKLAFLGKNWIFWVGMDATRWLKAKINQKAFTLTIFGDFSNSFAIDSSKLVRFGHIQNFALFGKNWLSLGKNGCN